MKTLLEKTLKDGSVLTVVRHVFPDEGTDVPEWLLPLFKFELPVCWHSYYDEVFGGHGDGCRDLLYAGLVNGVPCSRMWFGYSLRSGAGNFGNVMTLPDFRRRGIMRELLNLCAGDFQQSDALFCSCDAADTAAPAYASVGFRKIFGEVQHPMAIVHEGGDDFSVIAENAYREVAGAVVRPGTRADRFDCDKLLWYDPAVYGQTRDPEFPDYLSLWPQVLQGNAAVDVVQAQSGFCAGYSCRIRRRTTTLLHPRFAAYRTALEAL